MKSGVFRFVYFVTFDLLSAETNIAFEGNSRAVRQGNSEGNNAVLNGLFALVIMT